MAKIGIVCEEYKLPKFEEELKKANIEYEIISTTNKVIAIKCESEQEIVGPICELVTQYFIDLANQQKHN